jgi:hypothetical protein
VASSNVVASRDARVAKEVVQRGHILLSLLAFLRLETHPIEYRFPLVRVETLDSSIRFFSLYRFPGVLI